MCIYKPICWLHMGRSINSNFIQHERFLFVALYLCSRCSYDDLLFTTEEQKRFRMVHDVDIHFCPTCPPNCSISGSVFQMQNGTAHGCFYFLRLTNVYFLNKPDHKSTVVSIFNPFLSISPVILLRLRSTLIASFNSLLP